MIVGNTKKSQPAAFEVGERIARLIDTVSRLAGRADNREPLAVFSRGDRRAGYRPERHRASARAHVVELLFMHVSGKDVADVSSPHAFLRLRQARDINPLLGRGGAGVHEQNIVVPDNERQAREKGALLGAKLGLGPGDRGPRIGIERVVRTTKRCRIVVAEHYGRAVRRVLLDQIEHGHRIGPVPDQIAQKCIPVRSQPLSVGKAGGDRLQVAMDVCEKSQLHRGRGCQRQRHSS